jgi:hypothetical protein
VASTINRAKKEFRAQHFQLYGNRE